MDRSYIARNDASRTHLEGLLDSLTEEQLTLEVDGWSVGVHLAHLAFWDRFTLLRWQETARSGRALPVSVVAPLTDLINDAQVGQWAALHTDELRALVRLSAADCDAHVAELSDTLVQAAQDAGLDRTLDRSVHRQLHVGPVEAALGAG
ncbi:MAG: DinB family protein [Chloroflexi bacterium]|nr:DinB family protein [Chloroflexota bacterium]